MHSEKQSLHWVDEVVADILQWQQKLGIKKLHVDDMKTPSGRVHVGALRGVVLHDVVAKVLAATSGQPVTSTYVFNDMDSVDKIPHYLPQEIFQAHLGKPLYQTPAPTLEQSGIDLQYVSETEREQLQQAKSFAELYATDFVHTFRLIGCSQEIVYSHQLYESGQMDTMIALSFNQVATIKQIYTDIADYQLPKAWLPFKPFDNRPEVANAVASDWDGNTILVTTQDSQGKQLDQYRISPFGGTGKLLWKVDWPAHWSVLGVTIEGAGKDHTSAGGSRDMADAQADQVFHSTKPFDIPYEWILVRGAKMSSSKGVGTSAREFVSLFPPEIARFLFISPHYNQVIDFDPATLAIPDLFDEFDLAAKIFWNQIEGDTRLARSFELSLLETSVSTPHFLPRFRDIALWMQYPEVDLKSKFAEIKGSELSEAEIQLLEERKQYAQRWLNHHAPAEFQLTPKDELPILVSELDSPQKEFFKMVVELTLKDPTQDPADLQNGIYGLAKETIGAKPGFQALYQILIGKKSGPRAAWLLKSVPSSLLQKRLAQISESVV